MDRISYSEKKYIMDGISQDIRNDARHCHNYRPLELETSIIQQGHGSARVRTVNGGTDVLVCVKAEVMNTTEENPKSGDIDVNVDFTASTSFHFMDRTYELESIDLASKIKALIKVPGGFDLTQLCIVENFFAWKLNIDVQILDDDGNLYDIIIYAIYAALLTTRLPETHPIADMENGDKDFEINDDTCVFNRLNLNTMPLSLTLFSINGKAVVDCTFAEEECSDSSVSIAVTKQGTICKIQLLNGSIQTILLPQYIAIANKVAEYLYKSLETIVTKDDELWTSDILPDRRGFFA